MEKVIIEELLKLIEAHYEDQIYRDWTIFTEAKRKDEVSIYRVTIRGERDTGTPLYCGSTTTHIVKEDYFQGKLVYASIVYEVTHSI